MLSVALCTYNGSRYIRKQIESILQQTMPVDEIVVCDDGSTDDTLTIIESYQTATATKLRIYRNEYNIGVSANFHKAINLCNGDYIFLSDQDDIWLPNKTKVIVDFFEKNNDKQVVFSDGLLVDNQEKQICDKTLWGTIGFSTHAQKELINGLGPELFSFENRATGATMAFRRSLEYKSSFLDCCNTTILHDGALAMLGLAQNSLGFISQPLIKYRIHSHQVVGLGPTINYQPSDDSRDTSPLCELWYSEPLPSPL